MLIALLHMLVIKLAPTFPHSTEEVSWDKQLVRDRCHIDKLSQQLSDTTTQLTHISKVLDYLLVSHTPMTTSVEVTATPSSSPATSTAPPWQAPSLLQQSDASERANLSTSSFHINGQTAPHGHTGLPQPSQDLQYQTFFFQCQAHNST